MYKRQIWRASQEGIHINIVSPGVILGDGVFNKLYKSIDKYKKKFPDKNKVPRPNHWSGWCLNPSEIEFWLDGENRIHERLKYILDKKNIWQKVLLNP